MPGLGWRPWSSCAKFKWAGYEAIMVSDDLLLSSRSIGWVSSSFFMALGHAQISFTCFVQKIFTP
jgi:hypothetical protein